MMMREKMYLNQNLSALFVSGRSHITSAAGGVSQKLAADKRGVGLKFFQQSDFMRTKMWIERAIDIDVTLHDKQSHITC